MKKSRRGALFLGLGCFGVAAGWQAFGVRAPALEFHPIPGAPGWDVASVVGQSSGSVDYLTVGLSDPTTPEPAPVSNLFAMLHYASHAQPKTPIAVFTDFFCPYCRVFDQRIMSLQSSFGTSVSWHHLPLLGPGSEVAAKAAVAAMQQGDGVAFYAAMRAQGFNPARSHLREVAESVGLNGVRFLADMNGADVAAQLRASAAVARRLGIAGTPASVIDRRVIMGAASSDVLEALIRDAA